MGSGRFLRLRIEWITVFMIYESIVALEGGCGVGRRPEGAFIQCYDINRPCSRVVLLNESGPPPAALGMRTALKPHLGAQLRLALTSNDILSALTGSLPH